MATEVFSTPGATSWTCPAGVFVIKVRLWTGGGAGGDDGANAGVGGGGGWLAQWSGVFVTPGVSYNLFVGAGGDRTTEAVGGGSYFGGTSAGVGFTLGLKPHGLQAGADDADACTSSAPTTSGRGDLVATLTPGYDYAHGGGRGGCTSAGGTIGGAGGASGDVDFSGADAVDNAPGVAGTGGGDGGALDTDGASPGGGGGASSVGSAGTTGKGGDGRIEIEYLTSLSAGSGSFVVTGSSVNFRNWHLQANSGTFVLTGSSVSLRYSHKLTAGAGTFVLTGFPLSRELTSGHFVVTGVDVSFPRTYSSGLFSPGYPLPPIPPFGGGGGKILKAPGAP